MQGWQQLVGAIGGFAAVVGAIAWLIRTLFENMLKSSLADHQAQLASASSIQIERFKADLANAAAERKFHFEKLHEKRLEALADLHERCVNLGASLAFLQYQLDRRDRIQSNRKPSRNRSTTSSSSTPMPTGSSALIGFT